MNISFVTHKSEQVKIPCDVAMHDKSFHHHPQIASILHSCFIKQKIECNKICIEQLDQKSQQAFWLTYLILGTGSPDDLHFKITWLLTVTFTADGPRSTTAGTAKKTIMLKQKQCSFFNLEKSHFTSKKIMWLIVPYSYDSSVFVHHCGAFCTCQNGVFGRLKWQYFVSFNPCWVAHSKITPSWAKNHYQ